MSKHIMNFLEVQTELLSYPYRKEKDLTAVLKCDAALGFPHRSFRSIHVGGTNGKGSVSLKIAEALRKSGFSVGLYTSPHIHNLSERIQVDGENISFEDFCEHFQKVKPFAGQNCSFFDVLTAIAFLFFQKKKVDWAVIEVGLGGAFDATNVILPELSVITSIGYDHMQFLGNTLEEIARQKGGIVRPGVPLVVGPSAAPFFPKAIKAPPASFFDLENQGIARLALEQLGVSEEAIESGLSKRPRCRFEVHGNVVFDVAHNPDGFQRLLEALQVHFPNKKSFRFIVAFSKDKDFCSCIDVIAPHAEKIFAFPHSIERLASPLEIVKYSSQVELVTTIDDLFSSDAIHVVCGSFYFMDDVLGYIQKKFGNLF